jgi:DNA-binding MarR family transcriptional regulator
MLASRPSTAVAVGLDRGRRAVRRTPGDDVLLAALRLAMGISVRAADEVGDISPVQLRALTVLRETAAANLVQLAQGMGVTVSTASRLVDRLVAAGLAERRPAPQTRREIRLSLTRSGKATLARYDRLRVTGLRQCLDHLPAEQHEPLMAALRTLIDAVPDVRESPPPAPAT